MEPGRHWTSITFCSRRCILRTQTATQRRHRLGRGRRLTQSHGTAAVSGRIVGRLITANDASDQAHGLLWRLNNSSCVLALSPATRCIPSKHGSANCAPPCEGGLRAC
jgi:hypothetical protein